MSITWVLEREVFRDNDDRLAEAASSAGHEVIKWDDRWLEENKWPALEDEYVVFHGCLSNARITAARRSWRPGGFCNTSAFACHTWYPNARPWLVHEKWVFCSLADFVDDPERHLLQIGSPNSFFVRPDSPLKPFSGRVIQRDKLSLEALDYGFHNDDKQIAIVVTPVVDIGKEWRFVIADQRPIASSAYQATGRSERGTRCPPEVQAFAEEVAEALTPPDPIYILDVSERGGTLKLMEISPFSGADLYSCSRTAIVAAIERCSLRSS